MTAPSNNVMDLLTAYALNVLEPEEVPEVLRLLEEQPTLHRTLADLRETVDLLPYALPEAEPPPDLRQRTLDRAVGRARPAAPRIVSDTSRRLRRWLFALGTLAAIALVVAAVTWQQLNQARAEIAILRQQQQQIAEIVAQPVAVATLAGDSGSGAVIRRADGATTVAAHLPQLPPDRVYQFWLIEGSSAPVSGGTFTVDAQGNALITLSPGAPVPSADTFAVTNEPKGGSPGPTTPILISGQTTST